MKQYVDRAAVEAMAEQIHNAERKLALMRLKMNTGTGVITDIETVNDLAIGVNDASYMITNLLLKFNS